MRINPETGNLRGRPNGAHVEIKCASCNGHFSVQPYRIRTARFCSLRCKKRYRSSDKPEGIIRPVKGMINDYGIDKTGRIWSFKSNRWLLGVINTQGYVQFELNGKSYLGHRLTAKAWVKNPKNYPEINHKDGHKTNNYYMNLEWCTSSQNQKHACQMGLQKPRYKLSDAEVSYIRKTYEFRKNTYEMLAKELGVC